MAPKAVSTQSKTQRVTMAAVGKLAGVSQVTVSRALSNPSVVSPETLQRIEKAIEQTGFVPNALAGALASNKSRLISVLVPSINNTTYAAMVQAFAEQLRHQGYQLLLSETGHTPEEEEALIKTHLSRRPDAVMLTGVDHTPSARKSLESAAIPVVELWDLSDDPIGFCVGFDHTAAGQAVAEHALARGHRNAAVIYADDERAHRRKAAFSKRFTQGTGAPVADIVLAGPATIGGGRSAFAELLAQGFGSGVVFCSSDVLAHGVLIEAQVQGLSIPKDFSVIGFGDQAFAKDFFPALTTVRVDREHLGRLAATELLARLKGESGGGKRHDLGFELIERASTQSIKGERDVASL